MRLCDYSIIFRRYADLPALISFSAWDKDRPTASLEWYDAYNAVKHDRESQFRRALLLNAFTAVAACATLLFAQFGGAALTDDLRSSLTVEHEPWPLMNLYVEPQHYDDWVPTNHPDLT